MDDDKKKKGRRTTAELKAMAEKYRDKMAKRQKFKEYLHTNRFVHTPPEARHEDHFAGIDGNPGTDELIRKDYGYDWFGGKGLNPDYYMGG